MLNINPGYNQEFMENCQTLMEYMQYVAAVREYAKSSSIGEAVPKAEVVAMSIFEYNEDPDGLRQNISSQQDEKVLMKWLKLAAHADSIEEFARQISQ